MNFESKSFWMRIHDLSLSCMTKVRAEQIGDSVGKVEDVEVQEDGSGWRNFFKDSGAYGLKQINCKRENSKSGGL